MSDVSNTSNFVNGKSSKRMTVEFSNLPEEFRNISSSGNVNRELGKPLTGIHISPGGPLLPATRSVPKRPGMTLKFSEDVNTEAHEYHPPKTPYPYQSYLPFDQEEEEDDSDLDNEKDSDEEDEEYSKRREQEEDDLFPVDN